MTFTLSKLVWAALTPGTLLFLLLAVAFFWHRRSPSLSRVLVGAAALFIGLLLVAPMPYWVDSALEQRFPQAALPDHVDGIIVLGGAILPLQSQQVGHAQLNGAAERMTELVVLARRYPDAKLLFSGGSGLLGGMSLNYREADAAADLFTAMGVDRARLLLERESRNTWENALYSKKLADPKPGEIWLLVTSAWHMPRAVGCFRKAGFSVVPHPVDYLGLESWLGFDPGIDLEGVSLGAKEWVGLVAYHLMGRTDAWFPKPLPAAAGN